MLNLLTVYHIMNTELTAHYEELRCLQEIGRGAFSHVFKGILNGKLVAVKKITKVTDCIKNEVNYLTILKHPNIIRFTAAYKGDSFVIVTEYMDCSLDDLLYSPERVPQQLDIPLTNKIKVYISIEIAKGIQYLQSLNLIHGDIKPDNILVSNASSTFLTRRLIDTSM